MQTTLDDNVWMLTAVSVLVIFVAALLQSLATVTQSDALGPTLGVMLPILRAYGYGAAAVLLVRALFRWIGERSGKIDVEGGSAVRGILMSAYCLAFTTSLLG